MDDLIPRRAAIDALEEPRKVSDTWTDEYAVGERMQWEKDVNALNSLSPAQPSEIQDILEYLDTVLHPIVSPDHWNVYSELHDMISMLPSAQPERMTNRQWIDFLSVQFDISRTSAKEMLHGMMQWKKEDNFKKMFNGGKT